MCDEIMAQLYKDFLLVRKVDLALDDLFRREARSEAEEERERLVSDRTILERMSPIEMRAILRRFEKIDAEWYRLNCDLFEHFAHSEADFEWTMPDAFWRDVKKYSGLPEHARRTIEAVIVYFRANSRLDAWRTTPPHISDLKKAISEFLHYADIALVREEEEGPKGYIGANQRDYYPLSDSELEADRIDGVAELMSAVQSLKRFTQKFPITDADKKQLMKDLIARLDLCTKHFLGRPLTRGASSSNDIEWVERICRLAEMRSEGLNEVLRTYITGRKYCPPADRKSAD
jgi:hypothetical protein